MRKPGCGADPAPLLAFLSGRIAKWWIPDEVRTVDEIPHTAAGKINKVKLREMFGNATGPAASAGPVAPEPPARNEA